MKPVITYSDEIVNQRCDKHFFQFDVFVFHNVLHRGNKISNYLQHVDNTVTVKADQVNFIFLTRQ